MKKIKINRDDKDEINLNRIDTMDNILYEPLIRVGDPYKLAQDDSEDEESGKFFENRKPTRRFSRFWCLWFAGLW